MGVILVEGSHHYEEMRLVYLPWTAIPFILPNAHVLCL
jgi:hypothetical protein